MEREIYTPPTGPPQGPPPDRAIYESMGMDNMYAMIADFYGELEKSTVHHLFPGDMAEASKKTAEFLIGLMGGPPLYIQKHGPPRMRARHIPFQIDEAARQEWLRCFTLVLDRAPDQYDFPAEHIPGFRQFLGEFSAWMVNSH